MADRLIREQNMAVVPSNLDRVLMKVNSGVSRLIDRVYGWDVDWDYYVDTSDDWDGDNFWTDVWYTDYGNSSYALLYRPTRANTYETLSEALRLLYK